VQTTTQLMNSNWTTLTNVVVTNHLASLVDNSGQGRFYRLVNANTAATPVTCTALLAPPHLYGFNLLSSALAGADATQGLSLNAPPPLIGAQSGCTNSAFTYRWRLSPTSPNVSGWNTPSLYIPGGTFGPGFVTFWLDVTDSQGETRTYSRALEFYSGPPDA
jgi:hypothetical protein